MAVYLLHFEPPYKQARHYLGFCEEDDVSNRVARHRAGRGSPLVKAALDAGCIVTLAHVIPGATRTFERQLKKQKMVPRWCPTCGINSRPLPIFIPPALSGE